MASNKTNATAPTACECSFYDALVPEQLTEENLASGSYDSFSTGCTATTRNTFAPGHDAKLKSFLIKYSGAEYELRRNDGVAVSRTAVDHAKAFAFAHMVVEGIAKKEAKDQARASRAAARKAPKTKKSDEAGGTTHRSFVPTQPAASLAEIVAAEEAEHAAKIAASRPEPEWDDSDECQHEGVKDIGDECPECGAEITDLGHVSEEEIDEDGLLVTAKQHIIKVGRWEYKAIIQDDGSARYLAKDGKTHKDVEKGKYAVLRELEA